MKIEITSYTEHDKMMLSGGGGPRCREWEKEGKLQLPTVRVLGRPSLSAARCFAVLATRAVGTGGGRLCRVLCRTE